MHGQDAHTGTTVDEQVATVPRLEGAPVLREPPFELAAGHRRMLQHICSRDNTCVYSGGPSLMSFSVESLVGASGEGWAR